MSEIFNNGRLWSAPVEMLAAEMKKGGVLCPEKAAFYVDVVKRLETTQPKFAVCYGFAKEDDAKAYRNYVIRRFREDTGLCTLKSSVRKDEHGYRVCFSRGPKYGKSS